VDRNALVWAAVGIAVVSFTIGYGVNREQRQGASDLVLTGSPSDGDPTSLQTQLDNSLAEAASLRKELARALADLSTGLTTATPTASILL
jgi:hypothetical protein